ncbi:MAG: hypothetical protein GC181_12715 [Bacteroidetes bacterium]|nr:hypothetical protein [Bacteroidota bacterium]
MIKKGNYLSTIVFGAILTVSCKTSASLASDKGSPEMKIEAISADTLFKNQCFPDFKNWKENPEFYSLKLYNRWGELLFVSGSANEQRLCKDDKVTKMSSGTYFYVMEYKMRDSGQQETLTRTITIFTSTVNQ